MVGAFYFRNARPAEQAEKDKSNPERILSLEKQIREAEREGNRQCQSRSTARKAAARGKEKAAGTRTTKMVYEQESLQYLIEFELEDPACGIAKLVLDKGENVLSPKQKAVFDKHVRPYFDIECSRCHADVPDCELIGAWENDNLCSWCLHQVSKDD
jgi:hypothetical protein